MPRGENVTPSLADKAIELLEREVSRDTIASVLNLSKHTLIRINNCLVAAKAKNVDAIKSFTLSTAVIEHIYRKYGGVELNNPAAPLASAAQTAPQNDNTAVFIVKLLGAISEMSDAVKTMTAAINQIDNRLSTMQMTQAGLRGDFGKEAQRIVEALHVEGDIISKDQQKMVEMLDGIKRNTKRRPWQGEGGITDGT